MEKAVAYYRVSTRQQQRSGLGIEAQRATRLWELWFQQTLLGGKADVKIPPGTSSGKKLRLKGKGVTERGRVGDHYVTVQIDVPGDLDEDAKKQLIQLVTRLRKRGQND